MLQVSCYNVRNISLHLMFKHQLNSLLWICWYKGPKERGSADYGWLKPNYYFSFSHYHDPKKVHFGMLRVLNDDYIVVVVLFHPPPWYYGDCNHTFHGALKHKDNAGGQGVIQAGDIQIMSAGSGITHSEAMLRLPTRLHFFQVWVFPKREYNTEVRSTKFDINERNDSWQVVVSPREEDKALWINQDAVSRHKFKSGKAFYLWKCIQRQWGLPGCDKGSAEVNELYLTLGMQWVFQTDSFEARATEDSELLAIEVPMNLLNNISRVVPACFILPFNIIF